MSLWDEVKKNLLDWYGSAADKTGEMAKVGIRRYDIFGLSRDIERHFSEMGGFVYHALNEGRTDFAEDPVLLGMVEKVRELETELQGKENEIDDIREARRREQAESGADQETEPTPPAGPVGDAVDSSEEDNPV